jgi:hypothetical protein
MYWLYCDRVPIHLVDWTQVENGRSSSRDMKALNATPWRLANAGLLSKPFLIQCG